MDAQAIDLGLPCLPFPSCSNQALSTTKTNFFTRNDAWQSHSQPAVSLESCWSVQAEKCQAQCTSGIVKSSTSCTSVVGNSTH